MSASAPTVAANRHVEIPGFVALSERGHWDACSVVAEIDALHVCPWNAVPLAENSIDAWRWQYVQHGKWSYYNGKPIGTTLKNIYWHLTETAIHAHIAGYIPYSDTPNLTALHAFVKQHTLAQNPLIVQVVNAQALPHAEQGVYSHFVAIGGIDSVKGYLVANGDTVDALQTTALTVPLYWATWAQLVAAKISGAIALQRIVAPAPAPPPPPPVTPPPTPPIGLAAAIAQAETLLVALKAMEAQP